MVHRKYQFLAVLLAVLTPIGYARAPKKIVDGEDASILDFPYQVHVVIRLRNGFGQCGGTIIDARHILTAAHCSYHEGSLIQPENYVVITGTDNLGYRLSENTFRISRVTPHPNYNRSGEAEDDIAIFMLDAPLSFNDRQRPAELPTEDIAEGANVIVTGWGDRTIDYTGAPDPNLQKLNTTIISLTECKSRFPKSKLRSTKICTWSEERGTPCYGDSGGPLSSNGVVVGVSSQGLCSGHRPAIYTRVYSYLQWIRNTIRIGRFPSRVDYFEIGGDPFDHL